MQNRYFLILYSWFDSTAKMYLSHSATAITNDAYINHKKALIMLSDKHKAEGHYISPHVISITNIIELSEADYQEFIK